MESKYYTPLIEEFHIGFEYEYLFKAYGGDVWDKGKYTVIYDWDIPAGEFEVMKDAIKRGEIRVKHLDQTDIEDCGFIPDYERTWGERMCFQTENCAISYQSEIQRLIIVTNDYNFPITVKNKSEFKRLMKQLNITKE